MKRYSIAFAVVAGATALFACKREELTDASADSLRAHIVPVETRTSFDSYIGKFAWSEGDLIALHLSDGSYYEAGVEPGTGAFSCPTSAGRNRDFFAVYPASVRDADQYGNPQLGITLPSAYDISEDLSSDYAPVPMVAVNREAESDLYFRHVGGLLRITVNAVPAGTKVIEISMDGRITGAFPVRDASTDHPSVSAFAPGNAYGDPVRFAVSGSGLASDTDGIILNLPVPTGHFSEVSLRALGTGDAELLSQTQAVSFDIVPARGKKMYFGVSDYQFNVQNPAVLSHLGGTSADAVVTSSMTDRGVTRGVSWFVDGYYADADCTVPYDGADASNAPAWLTSFNGNGTGEGSATGEALTIEYGAAPRVVISETRSSEAEAKNAAIAASTFGAGSSPSCYYNLSCPAAMTSDFIAESANCYIVNGPGYFRIPLVMGNGVINDRVNPDARVYSATTGFQDYQGAVPGSPFLHESSASVGIPTSAFVVWEDVPGLIEVQDGTDFTLSGTPVTLRSNGYWLNFHVAKGEQGNAVIAVTDADGIVMWSWHIWVTDFVPRNYGGNTDVTVASSDPACQYDLMSVNLGWVVSGLERIIRYEADQVYVRIIQEGSGSALALRLRRPAANETERMLPGYAPYYQWGRKDALHPAPSFATLYGRYPGLEAYLGDSVEDSNASRPIRVASTIRNPAKFVFSGQEGVSFNLWLGYGNHWLGSNLWDVVSQGGMGYATVVKTIYDPSPASYSIPPTGAFSAMVAENAVDMNGDGEITYKDQDQGWYFYTDASRTSTVFFPSLDVARYQIGSQPPIGYWIDRLLLEGNEGVSVSGIYQTSGRRYDHARMYCFASSGSFYFDDAQGTAIGASVRPVATQMTPGVSSGGATGHRYDMGSETWQ